MCPSAAPDGERLRALWGSLHDAESSWSSLRVDRRVEGEDATSGFEYIRLSDASGVRLLRVIWNGGASQLPVVTDYAYDAGRPFGAVERVVEEGSIDALRRGEAGGRATPTWLALFDGSGTMQALVDARSGLPRVLPCDEWREREESFRSFTETSGDPSTTR